MTKKSSATPEHAASGHAFREAMSRFATGVTVVTAAHKPQPVGVTISSFTGVSLKPQMVLFCLDEKSSALPAFKNRAVFAVHVLAQDQEALAHTFARAGARDWKKIKFKKHKTGVPVLDGAMCTLICRLHNKVKAGDHSVIIGRVLDIAVNAEKTDPLLHTQRRYWSLGKAKKK